MNRQGPISKLIGGSIGLAQEYCANCKACKDSAATTSPSEPSPNLGAAEHVSNSSHLQPLHYNNADAGHNSHSSADDLLSEDDKERARMLEEMGSAPERETAQASQIAEDFIGAHPPPPYTAKPEGALPLPVIIPQRRPESRHHGFVRAYPPVLQNASID